MGNASLRCERLTPGGWVGGCEPLPATPRMNAASKGPGWRAGMAHVGMLGQAARKQAVFAPLPCMPCHRPYTLHAPPPLHPLL